MTIGEINANLDELVAIHKQYQKADDSKNTVKDNMNIKQAHARWLASFADKLSVVEHWALACIVLKHSPLRYGQDTLLKHYHGYALHIHRSRNSLRTVCKRIAQPGVWELRHDNPFKKSAYHDYTGLSSYLKTSLGFCQVELGNMFEPMRSSKTGFDKVLTNIGEVHHKFLKDKNDPDPNRERLANCLSLVHPAFCVETKLDGERMLMDYCAADGTVEMHSRNTVWYSNLYAPGLGPAIRRAVQDAGVDLILDGEAIALDGERQQTVPLGNNQTIAKMRCEWLGDKVDPRDVNQHADEKEARVKQLGDNTSFGRRSSENLSMYKQAQVECWLQFVIFDVIYVGGGDKANALLGQTVSSYVSLRPTSGVITHLSLLERKRLFFSLVNEQKDEVLLVDTLVVRPDGSSELGDNYFRGGTTGETSLTDDDSAAWAQTNKDLFVVNSGRRGRTDDEISKSRALVLNRHYYMVLAEMRLKGLMIKDLNTPYVLGKENRHWYKFKPDYFNGYMAIDIDLVIVGAYYASGMGMKLGKPSSFLVACVDEDNRDLFRAFCRVSAGSMDHKTYKRVLSLTGFNTAQDESRKERKDEHKDNNKWFSRPRFNGLPYFLSEGWNCAKGTTPTFGSNRKIRFA